MVPGVKAKHKVFIFPGYIPVPEHPSAATRRDSLLRQAQRGSRLTEPETIFLFPRTCLRLQVLHAAAAPAGLETG